jgi:hypothetical protein
VLLGAKGYRLEVWKRRVRVPRDSAQSTWFLGARKAVLKKGRDWLRVLVHIHQGFVEQWKNKHCHMIEETSSG